MLVLNPASGTVLKGETQAVEVTADGTKMVNGTYKLKLHLTSNEGDGNTEHLLPITYKVAGNLPEVVVPKIVNFGSLLVGESKTIEVQPRIWPLCRFGVVAGLVQQQHNIVVAAL